MKKNILLTIIMASMAATPSFAKIRRRQIKDLESKKDITNRTVTSTQNATIAIEEQKKAITNFLALANADEQRKTLVQIEADTLNLLNANPQWNNMDMEQLKREAVVLKSESERAQTNIKFADQELDQLNSQIKTKETEIAELNKKLEPGQTKVTELTKDIDELNKELGKTGS